MTKGWDMPGALRTVLHDSYSGLYTCLKHALVNASVRLNQCMSLFTSITTAQLSQPYCMHVPSTRRPLAALSCSNQEVLPEGQQACRSVSGSLEGACCCVITYVQCNYISHASQQATCTQSKGRGCVAQPFVLVTAGIHVHSRIC